MINYKKANNKRDVFVCCRLIMFPIFTSGTNDAYVTIKLGDEKFQTSVKERTDAPEWQEECDL